MNSSSWARTPLRNKLSIVLLFLHHIFWLLMQMGGSWSCQMELQVHLQLCGLHGKIGMPRKIPRQWWTYKAHLCLPNTAPDLSLMSPTPYYLHTSLSAILIFILVIVSNKSYKWTYFLQEIGHTFSLRTSEAHRLKKFENMFTGTLIHNLTIRKENNVIK